MRLKFCDFSVFNSVEGDSNGETADSKNKELVARSNDEVNSKSTTFHCALCLIPLTEEKIKRCGKCLKRVYCGRKCQMNDWGVKGAGQKHKNWCGLDCGEEDVDWSVSEINGKGQGIIAKRKFPSKTRIMVDGFRVQDWSDFAAACKTLQRSKLTNHECDPNAARYPITDKGFGVMVVYAQRDIEEGDEICSNYTSFNETVWSSDMPSIELSRAELKSNYGITCPPQCLCHKEDMEKVITEARILDATILESHSSVEEADLDLERVRRLLALWLEVKSSLYDRTRILGIGFRIAVQRKETLPLAMEWITEAHELASAIFHPKADLCRRHGLYVEQHTSHPDYLKLERT